MARAKNTFPREIKPKEHTKTLNILKKKTSYRKAITSKILLTEVRNKLYDPLGQELANNVEWIQIKGLSPQDTDPYPVAVLGKGSPVLMLHGFDSCFLEYRRLSPLLKSHPQLIIPDLYGFGFCPRPKDTEYGTKSILLHLDQILNQLKIDSNCGVIGASMGGSIAIELAKRHPQKINRLLLLAPAGLTNPPMPVPPLLDRIGVWFLSQPSVRRGLCKQAFADPNISVGPPEEQIASIHLQAPGWARSLAAFARKGGFTTSDLALPNQPFHVIWGANDRIITGEQKEKTLALLSPHVEEIKGCGHLPHLDNPNLVAKRWLELLPAV